MFSLSSDVAVSVVIPTHNRAAKLSQTLELLAEQLVPVRWEVIVVNNRCTDDTDEVVDRAAAAFPTALRVVHESTPGPSAARNCGIRFARGSLLILLDDDIHLGAGQLDRAVADHVAHPNWWFVARIAPLPEHQTTPFGVFRSAMGATAHQTDLLLPEIETYASNFAVVPRARLMELGGYDEGYPTASFEDADLYLRAHQAGIRVTYDRNLVGTHNDWAGATLRDYCRRDRTSCRTAPILADRFCDETHPWSPLIAANRPPKWSRDPALVVMRKLAKSLLSRPVPMAALFAVAETLERTSRWRRLRWAVYRSAIAASMYGGYQEGLTAFAGR
jgi:GT2 family glycosyltransferase